MRTGRTLALVMGIGVSLSCRKATPHAAEPHVLKNLEAFIEPVKAGLSETSDPRFLSFGPVPTAQPWDRPVATGSLMVLNRPIVLQTGGDGFIHERYEARPCPLKPASECVELWATGSFGGQGTIMCFGLQLQRQGEQVSRQELPLRAGDQCPYQTAPVPAPHQEPNAR